nr:reverse transcriptase domain-containing protein [Tanacetum cinerariifolium]
VNNPELTKRLNEHVPKTMEEMMITTTAIIRGEATTAGKKKGHTSWRTQGQSKRHASEKRSDFRGQPREGKGSSRFTPITRTPKEILVAEAGKFQPPPPMAMPTWCHMFNSILIGAARVWFDELPPESIDSYKDIKAAFLTYFMQQKKHVKDPVEINNIKQKDGETIEDFIERFKVEIRRKGAPECMRIFEFMHGVNNPELTIRLNEHVPKTMEEMMITTTAIIRGEAATAGKKKGHTSWRTHGQSKRHASKKRSDFRGQPREGRGSS